MNQGAFPSHAASHFPETRWSIVVAARDPSSPGSAQALQSICECYWYPIYAYARRCGGSVDDARDLTQGFFCRLLEKRWLDSADRNKGRLRTYLIVAFKNFSRSEWRRAAAQFRGGGQVPLHLDTTIAESRLAADEHSLAPDETFDRQWAMTLLEKATGRMRAEFELAGKSGDFDILKGCLLADRGDIDYSATASQLGISEGAARVATHRFRKRFREVFREEISQTLARHSDLEEEIRHLAAALAKK